MKCSYVPRIRHPIHSIALVLGISASLLATTSEATDLSIAGTVNGNSAVVTVSDGYGGAIRSFTFRGKEYINIKDLGREMQSSVAFDYYRECYNPNEAGNNLHTPSQLLSWSNAGNVLSTFTNMAFWLAPGQQGICGNGATSAVNTTVHSGLVFEKSVQFGSDGVPNVLDYRVRYHLNESRSYAVFETLTAYLQAEFVDFFTFDPRTSTLSRLNMPTTCYDVVKCQYQGLPVIAATFPGHHAMGIYAPVPPTGSYGAYKRSQIHGFDNFTKWNAVYVESPTTAGTVYERQLKVPFGTVEEVTNAMRSITGVSLPLIPVFRFYGLNDHFLTLTFSEPSTSYGFESTAFRVYATPQDSGMIPLYRCYNAAAVDHFVSADPNCEGRQFEGTYGYVSSYARPGYEPLYRFYKNSISNHLTTTNYAEGISNGYAYEGLQGYAPTANY